jgi:hypothetical protein
MNDTTNQQEVANNNQEEDKSDFVLREREISLKELETKVQLEIEKRIIQWESQNYEPEFENNSIRCEVVSERFQKAHDRGNLNYITTSIVNSQPVLL